MQALAGSCKASAMSTPVSNQANEQWRGNNFLDHQFQMTPANSPVILTDVEASAHENACLFEPALEVAWAHGGRCCAPTSPSSTMWRGSEDQIPVAVRSDLPRSTHHNPPCMKWLLHAFAHTTVAEIPRHLRTTPLFQGQGVAELVSCQATSAEIAHSLHWAMAWGETASALE